MPQCAATIEDFPIAFAPVFSMRAHGPAQDEGRRPLGRKTSAGRRAHEALPEPRSRPTLASFVDLQGERGAAGPARSQDFKRVMSQLA